MEIVLLGHMGRDDAAADRLRDHKLQIIGQWENPGLLEKATASGGTYHVVDKITNVERVADLVQAIEPDMFFTNFDDALAAGVVDAIKQRIKNKRMAECLIPCPDRAATRIEWDKFYLRELIDAIDPRYNPINFMAESIAEAREAIANFESEGTEIVLKPRNLTGGKGVKIQGEHFKTYDDARIYAQQVLASKKQTGIEIQEKLEGYEFTLQLFTDGNLLMEPPVTYDYPYREDGDKGPGTGGMGSFSMQDGLLPFVNQEDYREVILLMERLLLTLRELGHKYKGVLYPTFFKTTKGLKIVEVNARGGDPELINILDLMVDDVDFGDVLRLISTGELTESSVRFKKLASAMIYLVSPDYGYKTGRSYDFKLEPQLIINQGCNIRFAATENLHGNLYRTVGSSRTVGLSALGDTPWSARNKIYQAMAAGFEHPLSLRYRCEIAEEAYIKLMSN